MSGSIDFYFDYGSPSSYLAYKQIPGVIHRTGASVNYRPILLGGVFQQTANQSPMDIPAKREWMVNDLSFFAKRYNVPFELNPFFPINTLVLMRGAIFAEREGFLDRYSDAVFDAMWGRPRNMSDPGVIGEVLQAADLDVARIVAATQDAQIKDKLKADTQAAIERGVFGAPTIFLGKQLFFGQDRVPYVEELLAKA
ncbi:disulfide bond formation protein DsbA [Burkholderia sp. KK1]|uniref:2-hydroxychromene-2-carboxylate isomerase n=1 Tax=Caballeronia cordobensis TaxID=1353886 RepID=A0A158IV59_CABCO|nr:MULTISPECIES: 2-hydroxychromene-2-carboxylate isomerase [Caballeronia]AQH03055.1 disulfide bond formation protein DsbA [Burkholderia sp. KK1]MCE4573871.1 2-hydroxychromene-2-carboxylate isomerase [Caballeronia sp. CLC5]BBQ00718.1 2-hydroxychromene-2-carboxylate isomerase [Burkholderia sp. SFA1]SAL60524.1 DSBA oxidoreductase [Caballeronia cordobensis]